MSFGFRIKNDSSDVVVDADFRNHSVFSSGSMSVSADTEHTLSFGARSDTPILLIQPGGIFVGGASSPDSKDQVRFFADAAGTVGYAILDGDGALADSAGWGLRVLDGAGAQVYDARRRYLLVRDVLLVSTPPIEGSQSAAVINHASVPNAYYLISAFGGSLASATGFQNLVWLPMIRQTSNTTAEWHARLVSGITAGTTWNALSDTNVIVVCELSF